MFLQDHANAWQAALDLLGGRMHWVCITWCKPATTLTRMSHLTRLETRTKEFNACVSLRVQNLVAQMT